MRLIDADAMRQDWLENGENECIYDTNAILDSIDAQPTVDRWIPVTERLPELDEIVLAYLPGMKGLPGSIQTMRGWSAPIHASHWMPLPGEPKEEHNAEENSI